MATTGLTDVQIINMALRSLGEDPITALTDATRRAQLANQHWPTVRDSVLEEHPWRFARVRTRLFAYTEPAADLTPGAGSGVIGTTGVTFTASAGVFTAADVGKSIRGNGAIGRATVTGFSSTFIVTGTIVEAFSGTLIAASTWRLFYAAPAWGYSNTIPRPADCLRVWRKSQEEMAYDVESDVIVTDETALDVLYTRQVTDTTLYPPTFVQALVSNLAATFAECITGNLDKAKLALNVYEIRLKLAKARDGQEGTPQRIRKDELIRVRFGAR